MVSLAETVRQESVSPAPLPYLVVGSRHADLPPQHQRRRPGRRAVGGW